MDAGKWRSGRGEIYERNCLKIYSWDVEENVYRESKIGVKEIRMKFSS